MHIVTFSLKSKGLYDIIDHTIYPDNTSRLFPKLNALLIFIDYR